MIKQQEARAPIKNAIIELAISVVEVGGLERTNFQFGANIRTRMNVIDALITTFEGGRGQRSDAAS